MSGDFQTKDLNLCWSGMRSPVSSIQAIFQFKTCASGSGMWSKSWYLGSIKFSIPNPVSGKTHSAIHHQLCHVHASLRNHLHRPMFGVSEAVVVIHFNPHLTLCDHSRLCLFSLLIYIFTFSFYLLHYFFPLTYLLLSLTRSLAYGRLS